MVCSPEAVCHKCSLLQGLHANCRCASGLPCDGRACVQDQRQNSDWDSEIHHAICGSEAPRPSARGAPRKLVFAYICVAPRDPSRANDRARRDHRPMAELKKLKRVLCFRLTYMGTVVLFSPIRRGGTLGGGGHGAGPPLRLRQRESSAKRMARDNGGCTPHMINGSFGPKQKGPLVSALPRTFSLSVLASADEGSSDDEPPGRSSLALAIPTPKSGRPRARQFQERSRQAQWQQWPCSSCARSTPQWQGGIDGHDRRAPCRRDCSAFHQ